MRRRTLLACVGSLVMLVALALGPVQPARAGDLVVTAAVWLHPDHTGGRPQTVFPTADAHGDVSSTGNSMVDVNNANRQSTQTHGRDNCRMGDAPVLDHVRGCGAVRSKTPITRPASPMTLFRTQCQCRGGSLSRHAGASAEPRRLQFPLLGRTCVLPEGGACV
jgi:hypothetical protein